MNALAIVQNDLAAGDLPLVLLIPAKVESSSVLKSLSNQPARCSSSMGHGAAPSKSLLSEAFQSTLGLLGVRKVPCASNLTNFGRSSKDANMRILRIRRPQDSAAILVPKDITKTALGIYRYENDGLLTTAGWLAVETRTAALLEHIAGDPFAPTTAPVELRRLVSMVFSELHPHVCPPESRTGRPTTKGMGASLSYQY